MGAYEESAAAATEARREAGASLILAEDRQSSWPPMGSPELAGPWLLRDPIIEDGKDGRVFAVADVWFSHVVRIDGLGSIGPSAPRPLMSLAFSSEINHIERNMDVSTTAPP
ncbi:hypothetical protein FZEAL_504 [Fusarium zealandicum]|uniref:Uncharacterized protein n=1 Tax=Fusarium zealandicum TaxID=1053134 RepID=A0A8H4UUU8_9HYPO|nr:hypothetical protein FZEAL_504 [Fusarium zealandicum]